MKNCRFTYILLVLSLVVGTVISWSTLSVKGVSIHEQTNSKKLSYEEAQPQALPQALLNQGGEVLQVDDGTFERNIGLGQDGTAIYCVNRLTPPRYPATLLDAAIYFLSTQGGPQVGDSITVLVGTNPNGDTTIDGTSFQMLSASVQTLGAFNVYAVPNVTINSGDFVVGFRMTRPFPCAQDSDSVPQRRSYFSSDGVDFTLIDDADPDLAGNWGIRATARLDGGGGGQGRFCGNVLAGGDPPGSLQAFTSGAVNLGFVLGRSIGCPEGSAASPGGPQVTRTQLQGAKVGVEAVNSCLGLDSSRFDNLSAWVSGLSNFQLEQEVRRLIEDLRQAIRRANFQCDRVTSSAMESYYNALISLGTGEGMAASCSCDSPLPANIASAIRSEILNAQQNLRDFSACLGLLDLSFLNGGGIGAPSRAVESFIALIGMRERVQFAIWNADCCCTCRLIAGPEICGDGIDNDGDNRIDEGCSTVRIWLEDSGSAKDDVFRLTVDGRDIGITPEGNAREYSLDSLTSGDHTVVLEVVKAPDNVGTFTMRLLGGLAFVSRNGQSFSGSSGCNFDFLDTGSPNNQGPDDCGGPAQGTMITYRIRR